MHQILEKRILICTAHPDDECYATAGTIYANHEAGGQTIVFCATHGEKGNSHLKTPLSENELKRIRKKELIAACEYLNVKLVHLLQFPDGELSKHFGELRQECLEFAQDQQPEVILSFGEDGISGHLDHVTVGKAAKQVSQELNIPFYAFTLSPKMIKKASEWLSKRNDTNHYVDNISFTKPLITIPVNEEVKRKALAFHNSQMDNGKALTGYPAYAVEELLKAEYYIK